MKIKTAIFSGSSTKVEQKPARKLPEFAFIGRSNVGKSSLINALTGNSKLAKTSQTPGKTQLVNHFLINDNWYLVDLPGYGYARLPDKERAKLRHIIWDYINRSEELVMLRGFPSASSSPRPTSRARTSRPRRWRRTRPACWKSGRTCPRCSSAPP